MRYKVSGAIAIPKASWGCAPALPNRIQMVSLGAIFRTFHVKYFAACGQRSGLLALNLASIFEKLLDQKTFCFCAPHRWSNLFFILQIPHTFGSHSALFHVKQCSWKNNCVRFAESLRCLPVCCSLVVVLSELVMNLSQISVFLNFFCF